MDDPVERLKALYRTHPPDLGAGLAAVYAEDVVFRDPARELRGRQALARYLQELYRGVLACRFEFQDELRAEGRAALTWTMYLRHGRLRPRETLALPGASFLRFADKVHDHRDYFDLGALLYERLPLIGPLVRTLKARL